MNAKPRVLRSLKQKLVLPWLALIAALAAAILSIMHFDTRRQLEDAQHERARLIANMTNDAAEGLSHPGELQRIVTALGADREVLDIVVAGGQPTEILASTRGVWANRSLRQLSGEAFAGTLAEVIRSKSSRAHLDAEAQRYWLCTPIQLDQRSGARGPYAAGAVIVYLDARPMMSAIARQSLQVSLAMVLAILALSAFLYWRLDVAVLRPLAALSDCLRLRHEPVSAELKAALGSNDEIGLLSRTVTSALERTDAALRELANQKFALDQHSIVAVTDAHGKITYVNDKFCTLSQYSRQELIGRDHRIVNSKHHPKDYISDLWSTLKSGRVWRGELKNRAKDGSFYWVDSTLVPLLDKHGAPEQFIAIRTDITERKQAEEALIAAKALAEAASAAKGEFLANMSHEIRTPMNAILGMSSLLLDGELETEQRDVLEIIRRSGEALLGVINDVLDYSKIEAGKLEIEQRSFDVRDMIESVMDLFATQAAEKHLDIVYELASDVPLVLIGDINRLRQILVNLVGNALKFTSTGTIRISLSRMETRSSQATMAFCVSDTGVGIPHNKIAMLFQPFVQGDTSTTRRFGGTGLGLAICRRLAALMDGQLWVESTEGQGSSFYLSCPMRDSHTMAPVALPSLHGQLRDQRVLVIDDNPYCAAWLQRQLSGIGARVEVMTDTAQVLARVQAGPALAVILLDHELADRCDGSVMATLTATQGDGIPPLVIVGGPRQVASGGRVQGISRLAKPLKPRNLVTALARALQPESVDRGSRVSRATSRSGLLAATHPRRILLTEDNPVNRKVATMMLERMGYRTDVVVDGHAALLAASERDYDLIFMDMHMPEMDGLEATRRIRRLQSSTSQRPWIVALTASAMADDQSNAANAGMNDFVSKPVLPEDLRRAILRSVAQRSEDAATSTDTTLPDSGTIARLDLLLSNVAGCRESARMVVDEFLEHREEQLQALQVAVSARDFAMMRGAAHRHRGSLAAIHADAARDVVTELERAAQDGDADKAEVLLESLRCHSNELVGYLHRWCAPRPHAASRTELL